MIHETAVVRCRRCNRILTDPKAVAAGIGPVCAKVADERNSNTPSWRIAMFNVDKDDVVIWRSEPDYAVHSNVPVTHRHHSPSGFEFGYGGSGPADFALNVLSCFIPIKGVPGVWQISPVTLWDGTVVSEEAWLLHQEFKETFVVPMTGDIGRISNDEIRRWIDQKRRIQVRVRV